jgi:5-methylcytosine-specific restriction enzyme subunit McrC
MIIPIKNIYYLLCYAWDKLDESHLVKVDAESFNDLRNLFAKVLVNGLRHLFKKGLDREYKVDVERYRGIKGKLEIAQSLKQMTFPSGFAICSFDEFDHNVLQNQILKSTLLTLLKHPEIEASIRTELKDLYHRFHNVADIVVNTKHFSQVLIHRNNSFYKFLLNIARIIHENMLQNESDGKWVFRDFIRDEDKMAVLFEKFMFNFYKREFKGTYKVSVEMIGWQAEALDGSSLEYLPAMKTDISLSNDARKIILDAKYYKEAMTSRFDEGKSKFHSTHLYQMHAYLSNLKPSEVAGKLVEGALVYPTVQKEFNQAYKVNSHKLSLRTVNLNESWQNIEKRLKQIVS